MKNSVFYFDLISILFSETEMIKEELHWVKMYDFVIKWFLFKLKAALYVNINMKGPQSLYF